MSDMYSESSLGVRISARIRGNAALARIIGNAAFARTFGSTRIN